jgi:hypothetical protein
MEKDGPTVLSPEIMLAVAADRADQMHAEAKRARTGRRRADRADNREQRGHRDARTGSAGAADGDGVYPDEPARPAAGRRAGRGRPSASR